MGQKGFSIIMLLFIIVIIGLFVAVSLPQFASMSDDAKMAKAKQDLDVLIGAQTRFNAMESEPMERLAGPEMNSENGKPYDTTFFENYGVNPFISTEDENVSTFGMDVDTASYTIARRWLRDGNMPDRDSIRTEEFINYFNQDYTDSNDLFSIHAEGARSEFGQPNYHMLKIGIKAREITVRDRKPANMIFVVDVSGSMDRENRLELVKKSLRRLAEGLKSDDRLGLVIYGSRGEVISGLTADQRAIFAAIDRLRPGGVTNAEEGLVLAYNMAWKGFQKDRINRVILCSDGVANTGQTGADAILERVRGYANDGITLTTLGFGMGNYNDVLMEKLADRGDGNYYYIDTLEEADRIFSNGATAMLQTFASDAKIQVEFNPAAVDRFRLLGYENRRLETEDFLDDTVDAGEVGAGQTVTALYELRMKDGPLEYAGEPIADVRVRYRNVNTRLVEQNHQTIFIQDISRDFGQAGPRFRFTAAVAEFAEILKKSYWAKDSDLKRVLEVAEQAVQTIAPDERDTEFIGLVKLAINIRECDESPAGQARKENPEPGQFHGDARGLNRLKGKYLVKIPVDPWGNEYQLDEKRGEMRSAGQDQTFGTDDDICVSYLPDPMLMDAQFKDVGAGNARKVGTGDVIVLTFTRPVAALPERPDIKAFSFTGAEAGPEPNFGVGSRQQFLSRKPETVRITLGEGSTIIPGIHSINLSPRQSAYTDCEGINMAPASRGMLLKI